MIYLPKHSGTSKSFVYRRPSGSNAMNQSRNRNKRRKSAKSFSNTSLQNCLVSNDSFDLASDAPDLVVSDALVIGVPEVDKHVKRNFGRRAKKKGNQYKRLSRRKASVGLDAVCEGGICRISIDESSTISNSSCSGEHMSERSLSEKSVHSCLPVRATMGKNASEKSSSDILDPDAMPMTNVSCHDKVDESDQTSSLSDEIAYSEGPVDTDDTTERTDYSSQACSSSHYNSFGPVLPGKRGRHSRKVSRISCGVHRSSVANVHAKLGKDSNHSVWQRVRKSDIEDCICEDTSSLSSHFDIASDGFENQLENGACLWIGQNDNRELCRDGCVDNDAVPDSSRIASDITDPTEYQSKSNGELVNNIADKLRRRSGVVRKQSHNHNSYSMKYLQTGKTNTTMLSKICGPQKEVSNCGFKRVLPSSDKSESCTSGLQMKTATEKTESCPSGPKMKTKHHIHETTHAGNCSRMVHDISSHSVLNQISPSSKILDSLDMKCMFEVNPDSSDTICRRNMHRNPSHLVNSEGSHVEHCKQDQISAPVLQKWIPIGKRDAVLIGTSHINILAPDKMNSESSEAEQLSSSVFHCHRSSSRNVGCSSSEDAEATNKLRYEDPCMSGEPKSVLAEHNCLSYKEVKRQNLPDLETDLNLIMEAVKDAYKLQTASEGVHLATGIPVAEFERLLSSASPILGQTCGIQICKSCSEDKMFGDSLCRHQIPNIPLRNLWQWYEKPGNYGLEVKAMDYQSSKRLGKGRVAFRAYFVPHLSAVQLFGRSKSSAYTINGNSVCEMRKDRLTDNISKNTSQLSNLPIFSMLLPRPRKAVVKERLESRSSSSKDELCNQSASETYLEAQELLFEYFESDKPHERRPLFEKIKELVRGDIFSNSQSFGDPSKLERLNLRDVHPASWFSVAWYPIYRIPDGNFQAAFLTYHSLGHFIQRSGFSNFSGEVTEIVSPAVGLQSYKAKEEYWFQPEGFKSAALKTEEAASRRPSEILKARLRTLERTASVMARASVCKGSLQSVNKQPDYEFFLLSRRP